MATITYNWVFVAPWCKTHSSQFMSSADKNCLWDRVAGPRPDRGACEMMRDVTISATLEDRG